MDDSMTNVSHSDEEDPLLTVPVKEEICLDQEVFEQTAVLLIQNSLQETYKVKEEVQTLLEEDDYPQLKVEVQLEELDTDEFNPDSELNGTKDLNEKETADSLDENKCGVVTRSKKSKVFSCEVCEKVLKSRKSLQSHKELHSSEIFKCKRCDYSTNVRRYIRSHELTHNTKDPCAPPVDINENQRIENKDILPKGLKRENKATKRLKCDKCKYSTDILRYMRAHMNSTHSENTYNCPICNREFRRKDTLRKHKQRHSTHSTSAKNTQSMQKIQTQKCSECQFEGTRESLKTHKRTEHPKLKYNCSVCKYETKRKDNLQKHELIHLNFKLLKCSQCKFETNRKYSLEIHELDHTDVRRFKCDKCAYTTNCRSGFGQHKKTHLEVKALKCDKCDYSTNFKNNFTLHLNVHSTEKQLKCALCSYETNFKQSMRIHTLNHSSYRRFRCDRCDYGTNIKSSLKQHAFIHSTEYKFKCSACSYQTNFKGNLMNHYKVHGKENQRLL